MKTVFWLLVGVGLVYGFYSAAVAAYQYMQVGNVVEESVLDRVRLEAYERTVRVKDDILRKSASAGIMLNERDVLVTDEDRSLHVVVRWSYPVIVYRNDTILSVPISYDHTFPPPTIY